MKTETLTRAAYTLAVLLGGAFGVMLVEMFILK